MTASSKGREVEMRYSTKAWLGLGAYIAATEVCAPEGELLSQAVDRWLEKHPARTVSALSIVGTALHLLNLLPERYDPFAVTLKTVRMARR
jgi:hypothetical protein